MGKNTNTVVVAGFNTPTLTEESFQSFWNDIIDLKRASALIPKMVAILLSLTFHRLDLRMEMDDALHLVPAYHASPLEDRLKVSLVRRHIWLTLLTSLPGSPFRRLPQVLTHLHRYWVHYSSASYRLQTMALRGDFSIQGLEGRLLVQARVLPRFFQEVFHLYGSNNDTDYI